MTDLVARPTASGLEVFASWEGPKADRFREAIGAFLSSQSSQNTVESYARSLEDFIIWCQHKLGHVPRPDLVTRAHALAYSRWLLEEGAQCLPQWRYLARGEVLEAETLSFVADNTGCRIDDIAVHLRRSSVDFDSVEDLHVILAKMAKRTLRRSPSVRELRAQDNRAYLDHQLQPRSFSYAIRTPSKLSKSTLEQRLRALSSLWNFLSDTGENYGGEPLLKHNVWRRPAKTLSKGASSAKRAARAVSTPDWKLFLRILATTFLRSHMCDVEGALEIAEAAMAGEDPRESALDRCPLVDARDQSLLMFMVSTGARVSEISSIYRRDLDANGVVTMIGKGNKTRRVKLPDFILTSVSGFAQLLIDSGRPTWALPESPMFPGVKMWGRNARTIPTKGISRRGISSMMHRRAAEADPSSWVSTPRGTLGTVSRSESAHHSSCAGSQQLGYYRSIPRRA
jgi:site-specific recombinase XerD